MDETSGSQFQRFSLGGGFIDARRRPIVVGSILGVIAVWILLGIRDHADFEALQWWVYVNYDFTPRVNPFTIGPFLAGIVAGYISGFLTRGLYEHAIANAVKAAFFTGFIFYLTIVFSSIGSLLGAGTVGGDPMLIVTVQPLIFIAIPFTLVFMVTGIVVGPVGQYVRRRLLDEGPWPESEDTGPSSTSAIVRATIGSGVIAIGLTAGTWVGLYSIYLFLTP